MHRVVVIFRALASTTMNNKHIMVTAGLHIRRKTLLGDAHECMRDALAARIAPIAIVTEPSVPFLKPMDTQCKLEVELRLGCAHVNGTPGDERCEAL